MKSALLLALIYIILNINTVQSLYFHIRETERKCFIEEVPDETLVVGNVYHMYNIWITYVYHM